ncbi:lytic transglycosylase domain-containing protein [Danxiaibacter flavus]|uniref:Lytic transglycosylase domain-containing protein n=1 Tax=Danxiaibacter flavus TaxID=3049108 RepID=A0ABV3Z896_9BACT|nr:lytic transglycosylase domain-containing protein [Chitinophagaceae bacterium DXS]
MRKFLLLQFKPVASFVLTGVLFFSLMSFATDDKNKPTGSSGKTEKGFSSLFANSFDPSKPYIFQVNPKAISFVEEYIKRNEEELEKMKSWGKPYFDLYDRVLAQNHLPVELKYLSVIESHLRSGLISGAGAVGPWQLMRDEAKRYNLKVAGKVDERKDFALSTAAAAKLLKSLYAEFGDWLLVIAAYNCGVGRLKQAIKKADSKDFWELQSYLPLETRNHVKKFIATHYIFEGGGGWTTMTAKETEAHKSTMAALLPPAPDSSFAGTETTEISGRFNSSVIAKYLSLDLVRFNQLNPLFDKQLAEGKKVQLRLSADNMRSFKENKQKILQESVQLLFASSAKI